ncbi:MAG: hypothetical protein F6K41_05240 [Symploca sp. SIO3E6]|nr:hypothetical protein [Caldora sp. SIO3E6]
MARVKHRKIPRGRRGRRNPSTNYRGNQEISHLKRIKETPFYRSNGEPADPRDCARWPHSPWCGGNPFTLQPVGVEFDVVNSGCTIGVRAVPVFGFVRGPNYDFVYVKPRCRDDTASPPPRPQNEDIWEGLPGLPLDFEGLFVVRANRYVTRGEVRNTSEVSHVSVKHFPERQTRSTNEPFLTVDIDFDTTYSGKDYSENIQYALVWKWRSWKYSSRGLSFDFNILFGTRKIPGALDYYYGAILFVLYGKYSDVLSFFEGYPRTHPDSYTGSTTAINRLKIVNYESSPPPPPPPPSPLPPRRRRRRKDKMSCCHYNKYMLAKIYRQTVQNQVEIQRIKSSLDGDSPLSWGELIFDNLGRLVELIFGKVDEILDKVTSLVETIGSIIQAIISEELQLLISSIDELINEKETVDIEVLKEGIETINSRLGSDSFPIVFGGQAVGDIALYLQEMGAFLTSDSTAFPVSVTIGDGEQSQNLTFNDLQQLIEYFGSKIYQNEKILGFDEYPAVLPTSLLEASEDDDQTMEVANLPQLFEWLIRQFDALTGQYPVRIKIEDTDLTEEGNQEAETVLSNQSEALAEIYGQLMNVSINTELANKAFVKILIESGEAKLTANHNLNLLEALFEYLGVDLSENSEKIPLQFTPGEESIPAFLQESEAPIQAPVFKDRGAGTLNDTLVKLLQAASITKAANWRDLASAGNIANLIKNYKENIDKISSDDEGEWDEFVEKFEAGFINETGVSETQLPYGRSYDKRPKIREVGTDAPDNS